MITWASWIAANRKHAGLNKKELAERVGVDQNAVANWERGKWEPGKYNKKMLGELFGDMPG